MNSRPSKSELLQLYLEARRIRDAYPDIPSTPLYATGTWMYVFNCWNDFKRAGHPIGSLYRWTVWLDYLLAHIIEDLLDASTKE